MAAVLQSDVLGQDRVIARGGCEQVAYISNKGQWQGDYYFKGQADCAMVFLEAGSVRFGVFEDDDIRGAHSHNGIDQLNHPLQITGHGWRQRFLGCQPTIPQMADTLADYRNYLIGSKDHHHRHVPVCTKVVYRDLWPGIDMLVHSNAGHYSYQFEIHPGADPSQIRWTYEGLTGWTVTDSLITVQTSLGPLYESELYGWQLEGGRLKEVPCSFASTTTEVFFSTGNYDRSLSLVIDPTLIAATFVGSLSTSIGQELWAFHAGHDAAGNIFLVSMPTEALLDATIGAFDTSYTGIYDIGITKFNTDGTQRIWSTYLGGSASDIPANLVCNALGEPILLGQTFLGIENMPVAENGFDTTMGGFMDLFVLRLSVDGSQITGGTYLGGDLGEGGHFDLPEGLSWYSGGHGLALDTEGNVLVGASAVDVGMDYFPKYAFGGDNAKYMDAFVFKLGSELDSLHWCAQICSGYLEDPMVGGESIYDLDLTADGCVVITGSTNGTSMPFPEGGYDILAHGGIDGWLALLSADGQQLLAGTYLATDSAERVMMVDIGPDNHIWCTAVTAGALPETNGVVSNAGSQTYVAKFDENLSALEICTRVGANDPLEHRFYIKGFLVDKCGRIFISGHGFDDSIESFDLTSDAFAVVGGFYFGIYEPDMTDQVFGSLSGGGHNNGGISQYDEKGVVYQAICSYSEFVEPFDAMPGAFDEEQSPSYEAAVYKIDFESHSVVANFMIEPRTDCLPYEVEFTNWSDSASYFWDLGDGIWQGVSATSFSHTFEQPGDYFIRLACFNDQTCNVFDTASVVIHVPASESLLNVDWSIETGDLCADTVSVAAIFTGSGADLVEWNLDDSVFSDDAFNQIITTPGNHLLEMLATDSLCQYTQSLQYNFQTGPAVIIDSIVVIGPMCAPANLLFDPVSNADSTWWSFGDGNSNSGQPGTTHVYNAPGNYQLEVIGWLDSACVNSDTLILGLEIFDPPMVNFWMEDTLCFQKGVITLNTGSPAGGVYSGEGVAGNFLDLSELITGVYEIQYAFTDTNSCSNTVAETFELLLCDKVPLVMGAAFAFFPNPANESLMVSCGGCEVAVSDHSGKIIVESSRISSVTSLSTQHWAEGAYQLIFTVDGVVAKVATFAIIH